MYRLTFILCLITFHCFSQDWTWKNGSNSINQVAVYGTQGVGAISNSPGGRTSSGSWTDSNGNFWLFGGSISTSSYTVKADLWKYNPVNNQWTWVKGPSSQNNVGVYGTQGVSNPSNYPGARTNPMTWTDNQGNLWMYGGNGYSATSPGKLADLWKYNIASNQWTWVKGVNTISFAGNYGVQGVSSPSNLPGCRDLGHGFYHNGYLYLFGGNGTTPIGSGSLNDMWRYNISTNQWTWIKGSNAITNINNYGTLGVANVNNTPCGRQGGGFTDNGAGIFYFFGGEYYSNIYYSDLWKYDATSNQWTWIKGPNSPNLISVYGTQGVSNPSNYPGCRHRGALKFTSCGLYFFGGYGKGASNTLAYLNDLWKFDLSTGNWVYLKGTTLQNQTGVYGTLNVPATNNKPGAREYPNIWIDSNSDIWILGGWGYAISATFGLLSDLWMYNIPTPTISALTSPTVCSGSTITPTTFVSSPNGAGFTWTNSNTSIGIPASGSGQIAAWTAPLNNTVNAISGTITVTPSLNGCVGTPNTFVVTINPAPNITNNTLSQAICSGTNTSSVNWTSNLAGTTYSWTGTASSGSVTGYTVSGNGNLPAMSITNNSNTIQSVTYSVTPNTNGCNGPVTTYTITVNPIPLLTLSNNQTVCGGQTTATTAFTNSVAGGTFTYALQNPPAVGTVSGHPINGSGQIPNATITNSGSSPYTLNYTVTPSANNCIGSTGTYSITVNPAPTTTFSQGNQTICTGQNTSLVNLSSTTLGVTFTWSLQGAVPAGLSNFNPTSGTSSIPVYTNLTNNTTAPITVTFQAQATTAGAAQCPGAIVNYTITVNPSPIVGANFISNDTVCSGQNINITLSSVTAGTTFTWTASNGAGVTGGQNSAVPSAIINQALSNISSAVGSVTYTITPNSSTCIGTPLQVLAFVNPVVTMDALSSVTVCPQATITPTTFVSTPNGASFTWTNTNTSTGIASSGNGQISPWEAPANNTDSAITGIITVNPTFNGCAGTPNNFIVEINPTPAVTNNSLVQSICSGESTNLVNWTSNLPGSTFSWIGVSSDVTIAGFTISGTGNLPNMQIENPTSTVQTITYTVSLVNNGCNGQDVIYQINVFPIPVLTSSNFQTCNGNPIEVFSIPNIPGGEFSWSNGNNTNSFSYLPDISETLTVSYEINGCISLLDTIQVNVLQLPLVVITPDGLTTFCQESSVELVSNSSTGNLWSNNSTNSSIVATESGTYSLTITDSNGCSNTAQIIITNTGDPCIQINGVFTPNGDGTNDTWTIPGIEFYQNVNVEILNRWGQQLFLSNGYQTPWDGTYNGEKLPVGDYFYIINLENGIIYKGALTLKY